MKKAQSKKTEIIEIVSEHEKQARVAACVAELQGVLAKYDCALEPSMKLTATQIVPEIRVVVRS